MIRILICFSILFFITFGCSKKLVEIDTIDETTIDEQMITVKPKFYIHNQYGHLDQL